MNKEKILTIHNHKNFSGAARSLGEFIRSLEKKLEFVVICPRGSSSKYFKSLNVKVYETSLIPRFNHFELGYYKGLRWFLIFRELIAYINFFFFLIRLKLNIGEIKRFHLNEFELIINSPLLKFFFDCKISSHLRCPLEIRHGKLRYNLIKKICKKYIDLIIAIDHDCFKTTPIRKITKVIYNGIIDKNLKIKKMRNKKITFGFVGNFIERKGIYLILELFKKLKKEKKIRLLCVGKRKQFFNILNVFKYERNFDNFFKKNNIDKCKNIEIHPIKYDLSNFYSKIDIILFPSYMNAVGRPVIEAALSKKPAIIALKNYNNDTARKDNCLVFEPGNIYSLEKQIQYFIKNRSKIKKYGNSAFKFATKNFDIKKNSMKFYNLIRK